MDYIIIIIIILLQAKSMIDRKTRTQNKTNQLKTRNKLSIMTLKHPPVTLEKVELMGLTP